MRTILVTLLLFSLTTISFAQQAPPATSTAAPLAPASDDTATRLKALEEKIVALEAEVKTLKEAQALPAAPSTMASSSSAETAIAASAYPPPAPAQVQGPTQGGVIGGAQQNAKLLSMRQRCKTCVCAL